MKITFLASRAGITGKLAIALTGIFLISDRPAIAQTNTLLFDFESGIQNDWSTFGSVPTAIFDSSVVDAHSGNIAIEFRQSQFAAGTNGFGGFFSNFAFSPMDWTSYESISYWVKSSSTTDANRVQIEIREAGNGQQWVQRVPTVMSPTYQQVDVGFNTIDFERSVIGSNTNDTTLDLDNIDRVIFVFKPNLPVDPPIAVAFVDTVELLPKRIIYVSTNGSNIPPFDTVETAARDIQSAMDQATFGGTVEVLPGTYDVSDGIRVTNAIFLMSSNGREQTILDGNGSTRDIDIIGVDAMLSGFTVTNGGGVYCNNGMVIDCVIEGNRSDPLSGFLAGGGVVNWNGTIQSCMITRNEAAPVLSLEVNSFSWYLARIANFGGGVQSSGGQIIDCDILENTVFGRGGGVIASGNTEIRDCRIKNNTAVNILEFLFGISQGSILPFVFESVPGNGGGIYVDETNSTVIIEGLTEITGNMAEGNGGGVYADANANFCISTSVVVRENMATLGGDDCFQSEVGEVECFKEIP